MKTIRILVPVMVLTAVLLVGCGCRNSKPATTMPTTMPTVATTQPTTEMTTMPTTAPTTQPMTDPTLEDGNGPLTTDSTAPSDGAKGGQGRNGMTGSISGGMTGTN